MNRSLITVAAASIAVLIGSAALAESPSITRQPVLNREASNNKVIESLRADRQAALREVHLLIKGPAASLERMKIVELNELIDRPQNRNPTAQGPRFISSALSGAELTDERAYAIEFLRDYAADARNDARGFTKGPAAALYRMKVVQLDELIGRIRRGDTVSYEEVDDAMRPPAILMASPP